MISKRFTLGIVSVNKYIKEIRNANIYTIPISIIVCVRKVNIFKC